MLTKLYIGSELADFSDKFNIVNSIGDIRNTDIGSVNKSYTLDLPLTKTNKRLLKHISQPDVKTEVSAIGRLYLGETLIISGVIQVMNWDDKSIKIIVNSDDWIEDLKDPKINELDLSAEDHALTATNVAASWTASYPYYRYPMINTGAIMRLERGASANWSPADFVPMISISKLISSIFASYTISSSWLSSNYIKDLYLLGKEIIADGDFIKDKQLNVAPAADTDNQDSTSIPASTSGNSIINNVKALLSVETADEGSDWSNDTYTVPVTGTYKFEASFVLHNNAPATPDFTITNEEVTIEIVSVRGAVTTVLATISAASYVATELIHNITYAISTDHFHLEAGDEVSVMVYIECSVTNGGAAPIDLVIGVKNTSTFKNVWSEANRYSGVNKNIELEKYLPDITFIDFLSVVKSIFNLKFWLDKQKRVLYIEPWDSFVSSTVIDLTALQIDDGYPGETISQNYRKEIVFQFKNDSDLAYEDYIKINTYGPGRKSIALTSLFAQEGTETRECQWSSIVSQYNPMTEFATPAIINSEPITPYLIFDRKVDFNTRIVHWDGLTAGSWVFDSVSKATWPKVSGIDFIDVYEDYWIKTFHNIDRGKIYTLKIKATPNFINQLHTVINTATSEGFRPIYQATIKGVKNYFILQKTTTDGSIVELEMILK